MKSSKFLDGQMLVAMPGIGDPRFERTVIFMCSHNSQGAMGFVVNKPADNITFKELLLRLDIIPGEDQIELAPQAHDMHVNFGGPVETGRGFVLHSADYFLKDSTLPIDEKIGLTATLEILRAIATGKGPRHALLTLGYAGWGPGQLEREILQNGWLHCEPDDILLFGADLEAKYDHALRKIGIDPRMLSSQAGHA
jgi:putative transcriptional regulator